MTQEKLTMMRVSKRFLDKIQKLKIHPRQSYEEIITKKLEEHGEFQQESIYKFLKNEGFIVPNSDHTLI